MNTGARARATARGFTLLEAIVAMTIFSLSAVALYGWQVNSLRSMQRIENHARHEREVRYGLGVIERINPTAEPRGERVLGSKRVRWQAREIEPVKSGKTSSGPASLFDVGLYDVEVIVEQAGKEQARFKVRRVGYRQPRKLDLD